MYIYNYISVYIYIFIYMYICIYCVYEHIVYDVFTVHINISDTPAKNHKPGATGAMTKTTYSNRSRWAEFR